MSSKYTSMIIVTGGTTGLGYACAQSLAQQQPHTLILICARSGEAAATQINTVLGQDNVSYRRLDLSSLADVRRFAAAVLDECQTQQLSLSALVLNAALQIRASGLTYTTDGVEMTFGVAHVGHSLLTLLLLPHLRGDARVVFTSSGVHDPLQKTGVAVPVFTRAEEVAHPASMARFDGGERYSTSKLCNVLWTYALARRLATLGASVTVTAMDPGLMPGTGLGRDAPGVFRFIWEQVLPHMLPVLRLLISPNIHTPAESGAALAHLAINPDVQGISGRYFEGRTPIASSQDSYDEAKQEDLWEWTARFVGRDADEVAAFRTLSRVGC